MTRLRSLLALVGCVLVAAGAWAHPLDSSAPLMPQPYKPTYIASVSGQATTAAYLLSLESPAGNALRITRICVATSPATAAAAVTVTVRRTTSASSGGSTLTAEGTSNAISKLDPNDPTFSGIARLNGTPGTAGATLDQWGFVVPVIASGGANPVCQQYGLAGSKLPIAPSGVANGISINVSAAGAGGLADGTISVEFQVD